MDIKNLNSKLNNVRGTLDFENLTSKVDIVGKGLKSLSDTKMLLNKVGNSINGIKSVTESLPEAKESIANLIAVAPIVELTNKMPGLEDKMNKSLTAAEAEIVQQMSARPWTNPDTGFVGIPKTENADIRAGIKKANKLLGTPASIQSNINKVTGSLPKFDDIMKGIVPTELLSAAKDSLDKVAKLEALADGLGTNLTGNLNRLTSIPTQLKGLTSGLGGISSALNVDLDISIKGVDQILKTVTDVDNSINAKLGVIQNAKLSAENHIKRGIQDLAGSVLSIENTIQSVKDLKEENFTKVINDINKASIIKSATDGKIVPWKNPNTGEVTTFGSNIVPYVNPDTGQITIPGMDPAQSRAIIESQLGISISDIENKVNSLTTDLSTNVETDDNDAPPLSAPQSDIGQAASNWDGNKTTISDNSRKVENPGEYAFTRVNTYDELVAEFNSVKREITEMIVHWSSHFLDQAHAGAAEVHARSIALNHQGCSYHYIIKKNGQIERGRPVYIEGEHAPGHDKYSIGIAFIGGLNSYSSEKKENWVYGRESLTSSQYISFDMMCKAFYTIWPGCSIFGHNELQDQELDPGFDVGSYLKNRYKKTNQTDPSLPAMDQDALVGESPMASDALTQYNAPNVIPTPAPAVSPNVVDKEQVKTAIPLPEKIPVAVHGYDEIVSLLNDKKLKAGDVIKSFDVIPDEVLRVGVNNQSVGDYLKQGLNLEDATNAATEIKDKAGKVIETVDDFKFWGSGA